MILKRNFKWMRRTGICFLVLIILVIICIVGEKRTRMHKDKMYTGAKEVISKVHNESKD